LEIDVQSCSLSSQILFSFKIICKEEPDPINTDDESPLKNKKKDPNKVDKKFLYPHGVTPSLKNVRKRRFRKTLKKKNVELPEIEKEVKRLLRVDNEACNVKWEIVESEEPPELEKDSGQDTPKGKKGGASTSKGKANKNQAQNLPVDEHHLFGEEVSDSDEDANVTVRDLELDDTRLSEDSRSRFSDSNSMMMQGMSASNSRMMTEFKSNMFGEGEASTSQQHLNDESIDFLDSKDLNDSTRISEIRRELHELRKQQSETEQEIQTIVNNKLRERLQEDLDNLMGTIIMKEMELDELLANSQNM
jgi:transcription initiation factor TFIID subunit 7